MAGLWRLCVFAIPCLVVLQFIQAWPSDRIFANLFISNRGFHDHVMAAIGWMGEKLQGLNSSAQKRTIEMQTAYVYRKVSAPHYSVILGSSGKSIEGPAIPSPGGDEIHRVQGFLINNDDVLTDESSSFSKAGLLVHNRYRILHHASPLTWSDNLARQAERVAYKLAKGRTDSSKRSEIDMDTVGENIEKLFSVSYNCDGRAAIEAVDRWYKEGDDYSFSYPHLSEKTNSFTQLIWKGTTKVGMGCALKKGLLTNDVFVVALYSPPGNVKDDVGTNVLRSGELKQKDDVYSNIF